MKSAYAGGVMLFCAFFSVHVADAQVQEDDMTPHKILAEINKDRIESGIGILRTNAQLQRAAQRKAEDMIRRGYFAHNDPDGVAPWKWIDAEGYRYQYAGENLAIGFTEVKKQNDAWMKSEFHRRNILNAQYQETGIAVVSGKIRGKEELIVVQFFGQSTLYAPMKKIQDTQNIIQPFQSEGLRNVSAQNILTSAVKFMSSGIDFVKNKKISHDIRDTLLMSLLVLQTSISFMIASRIYVRVYRHVRAIDLHDAML